MQDINFKPEFDLKKTTLTTTVVITKFLKKPITLVSKMMAQLELPELLQAGSGE